ncbi:MAG: NADH-quinone oxidoreductase subunit NuoG [Bacteroidetes bacterium]|nr:NADH-quinone oxidoreductase subunit NuoG [Bacteroidota bacterium]
MATIYIDNQPYQVGDGQNLLQACLSLGFDIPYFCWHPAMGSVGACRQCAVKQFRDENDTKGKIVMSCMTPAEDGTRISIDDPEAKDFRASIIEWLMENHPHDCPVCDEGSECHLQDMTVMTGHTYRRFRFPKRTHVNQDLGPFVTHEMNRCIQCYRCVRFYRDYAGGRDLDVFAAHNHVYFGRQTDGTLESEFAGNLVEVCPTGVFTDKTLRPHYTRKWDLQTAPSVCVHCGVGCNTIPSERYGELRRIRDRYNGQVNGYFLCDRGRYGYEFMNGSRRVRQPLLRGEGQPSVEPASKEVALERVAGLLSDTARVIGIGSPRASLEANFALHALVGEHHFYAGVSGKELGLLRTMLDILQKGPARSASLHGMGTADAVLVLGEDVTNTAPMMALALRQSVRQQPMSIADRLHISRWDDYAVRNAVQQEKGPLFIATPHATKLDDVATRTYRAAPDDLARLGFAVACAVHDGPPPEKGVSGVLTSLQRGVAGLLGAAPPAVEGLPDTVRTLADTIAKALQGAQRPLVVAGSSIGSEALLHAAADVAWALCQKGRPAALAFVVPECNSLGLALTGERSLDDALRHLRDGRIDTVVVLENDLYRRMGVGPADELLDAKRHVVAIDHTLTPTAEKAEVVLPAATFAEGDGTLVNSEGRAQRFYQVFVPGGSIQESWRWVRDMAATIRQTELQDWQALDDVVAALAGALPVFRQVPDIAPPAGFRVAGLKIARQHERYSGRTAMLANVTVHEPRPPDDPDSALAFTMEGYQGEPPPPLIPRFWAPGWNSPQAINKFQSEVGGPLRGGDPGRRLIEPAQGVKVTYFHRVPAATRPRRGEWLIVPIYHAFGSEELSALAPGVAMLAPRPYVGLNPEDAASVAAHEGTVVDVELDGQTHRLPVKHMPSLPQGIAAVPAGIGGIAGPLLPAWGKVRRAEETHA